jgi:hypothetical protein
MEDEMMIELDYQQCWTIIISRLTMALVMMMVSKHLVKLVVVPEHY